MSQKLTPDVAAKVIRADLKNIIDKVAKGRPLSGPERTLFETLNLESEDLAKRRQLALLSKWVSGKRLNQSELNEIGDLLPEGSLGGEEVEASPLASGRTEYKHEYAFYEALYGVGKRTIPRWVAKGREAGDLCPLDDPAEMRLWWTRNMKQKCPDKLLAAAVAALKGSGGGAKSDGEEVSKPEGEAEETGPKSAPWEFKPVEDDEVGLEATLSRLRTAEVHANRKMLEALERGDEAAATLAQNLWTKLTQQIRQTEKDYRVECEAKGHLIPKVYAETRIVEYHTQIERGIRGLYRRMCETMNIVVDPETEAVWNNEVDRVFNSFQEAVFK